MHLKRDTDYALRIMTRLAEELKDKEEEQGVAFSAMLMATGIPRLRFFRICSCLEEKGLVRRVPVKNGEWQLRAGEHFREQSLLSVAEAVEGSVNLFGLFDQGSYFAQTCRQQLEEIQSSLNRVLSEATIGAMAGGGCSPAGNGAPGEEAAVKTV